MTAEAFLAFYPQFAGAFPEVVLSAFVAEANLRFSDFLEDAEPARRLLTAHRLTRYAQAFPPEGGSASEAGHYARLASAGEAARITSRKVDDVAVTYAARGSASAGGSALADLEETPFGLQLLALLRLHAWPVYVP